jgi:peptidoglycan/LPS O-acetylase OafA/YrhL
VRAFLENNVSARLGEICFPLYLLHGPVMWILGEPLMRNFGETMTNRALIDVSIVAVSFAAAIIFLPVNWLAVRVAHLVGGTAVRLWRPLFGRFKPA